MMRINRAFRTFVLVGLLMPGLSWAEQGAARTYLISGGVGAPGVTLKGLPGNPTSDQQGFYSVQVGQGWSGTVAPMKAGYVFEPATRVYSSVQADQPDQNYTARLMTFTISGTAGAAGVVMQGLPGNVHSDADGAYSATVVYGWSGVVVPEKPGFRFEPSSRPYSVVREDLRSQDYHPSRLTFTISGTTGVAGVMIQGLPQSPVTDSQGSYRATVEYGWSGTVTPKKEGYEFEPERREYSMMTEPMTREDYVARELMYRISGNVGLPGVVMEGLPDDPISDAEGNYSARVPYGWSGRVTPVRGNIEFEPRSREYERVVADFSGLDYVPSIGSLPSFAAGAPEILLIPTWEVDLKDFAETREDMQVMLHILREKLSEPRMILGVLYDYGDFFGGGGRDIQAIYLQGYAALFVMEVDFPLSFPSEPRGEGEPKEEEPVDPVWQRARQRLYAPPGVKRYGVRGQPGGTDKVSFEQFQEDLVKTLRHAANIRNVEPNEWVILTVVGRDEAGLGIATSGRGMSGMTGGYGGGMMGGGGWVEGSGYGVGGGSVSGGTGSFGGRGGFYMDSRSSSRAPRGRRGSRLGQSPVPGASTTVLTIQAKKADIDALARDDIDHEQFRQRVKVWTY